MKTFAEAEQRQERRWATERRRNKKQSSQEAGKKDLCAARAALCNDFLLFLFFFWWKKNVLWSCLCEHRTLNEMKSLCLQGGLFSSQDFWREATPSPVSTVTAPLGPVQTGGEDGNLPHSTDCILIANTLKTYCWGGNCWAYIAVLTQLCVVRT